MTDETDILIAFEISIKQVLLERVVKDPLFVVARFLDFNPVILDAPIDQRPGVEHLRITADGVCTDAGEQENAGEPEVVATKRNAEAARDETYFSYSVAKGKSFLLRCTLSGLKVRVDKLPLLILVYTKPATPASKTRVVGSCLLRLGELLTRFRRRIAAFTDEESAATKAAQSEADSSTQPLFDLNGRVSGFTRMECAFVKYADAPPQRSNMLMKNTRFGDVNLSHSHSQSHSQRQVVEQTEDRHDRHERREAWVKVDAALQTEPQDDMLPPPPMPRADAVQRAKRTMYVETPVFTELDDEQAEQLVQPAPLRLAQPQKASATSSSSARRLVVNFHTAHEQPEEDSEREDDWTVMPAAERERSLAAQSHSHKQQQLHMQRKGGQSRASHDESDGSEIQRRFQRVKDEYPLLAALLGELLGPMATRGRTSSRTTSTLARSRSVSASRSPSPSRVSVRRDPGAYMDSTLSRSHGSCPRLHRIPVESAARPDISVLSRKPKKTVTVTQSRAAQSHSQAASRAQTHVRKNYSVRPTRSFLLRRESSAALTGRSAAKHFERPEVWERTYVVS